MGSVAEREKQAHAVWQRWRRHNRSDSTYARKREVEALDDLLVLCAPEFESVFAEAGVNWRGLPQSWWRRVAVCGIQDAAQTREQRPGHDMLPHARECFTTALHKLRRKLLDDIRSAPASEVLDKVLELPRPHAAAVIETLTPQSRGELGFLAGERRSGVRPLWVWANAPEPKDHLNWIAWYAVRSALRDAQWKRSDADAPMNTYVHRMLLREANKYGHGQKDPESLSRLERIYGVSRDRLRRFRDDPRVPDLTEFTPDGDGGLYYTINIPNTIELSAEIARKDKPGPKKHSTSE